MSRDNNREYSVLMIGNSFSYYNKMNAEDGIFYKIAESAGYKVKVTAVYKGGYYLHQFLDPNDPYGKEVKEKLESNSYDIIVIQEQSSYPIRDPKAFFGSCEKFKELADKNGAELYLYATWGYHDEHAQVKDLGGSAAEMEMRLRREYSSAAKSLGAGIAQVGAAFTEFGNGKLIFDTDLKHPSLEGSTLAAYTLVGSIFRVDPMTLSYSENSDKKTDEALRSAASRAISK